MDALIRLFVLSLGFSLALVSANDGTGDYKGVTCMEAATCIPDETRLTDALNNFRRQEACEIVTASDNCLQSALDDCTALGVPESTIKPMLEMQKSYQPQMKQLCDPGPSTGAAAPEKASCMQINLCAFDTAQVETSLAEGRLTEACMTVTPSAKCLRSAYNDCKEKNMLPEDQLNAILAQVTQVESVVKQRCDGGDGGSGGYGGSGTHCEESEKCMPDEEAMAKDGSGSEACKMLISSQECFKEAIRDCKTRQVSQVDLPAMEKRLKSLEPRIQEACQPIAKGGVHCLLMKTCEPKDASKLNEYKENKQHAKACSMLTPFVKCQSAALDDCKSRGFLDSESIKRIDSSIAFAQNEINKLNCPSGNSAAVFKPVLHIFLAPLWIFLMVCVNSIM